MTSPLVTRTATRPATRVVFDFGAVLLRWRPAVLVARAMPQRARDAASLQATVATLLQGYGGDWGDFDRGLIDAAQLCARIQARTGWPASELQALLQAVYAELQVQPAVLGLLLLLRERGVLLSYLSNMPPVYADHLAARYPLHQWFESGVFSGRVQLGKPDPRIFEYAARRFGSAPQDCLLVDDQPANIEAARAAGWQAERFTGAGLLAEQLRARGLLA